jgi:subtilisin family serine protease
MKTYASVTSLALLFVVTVQCVQESQERNTGVNGKERYRRLAAEDEDFQTYWSHFEDNPNDNKKHFVVKWTSERGHGVILNMTHVTVLHDFKKDGFVAVEVDQDNVGAVLELLVLDPDIEAVEEDSLWVEQGTQDAILTDVEVRSLRKSATRNLAGEITPYGIKMVQADQLATGGSRALVCIVDTGVIWGHPDLDFNKISGADRRSNKDSSTLKWNGDTRGHGTHIAGTVAAKPNNGIGVRGIGTMPLYITRGLNNLGQAYESDVRDAMEQCLSAGAKVISLSLAGSQISSSMMTTLDKMYDNGLLIFAASGNGGGLNKAFPAAYPKVVSIGAVTEKGTRWRGSNYGWNELMAPGDLITSTSVSPTGSYVYANYSGTSMATPHAAGAAALLWSHFPGCTNTQIRYALAYSAQDVDNNGCDKTYGYGIVKVKAAYNFLSNYPCQNANWGQRVSSGGCTTLDATPKKATTTTSSWAKKVWWK